MHEGVDAALGKLLLGRHSRLVLVTYGADEKTFLRLTRNHGWAAITACEQVRARSQPEAALRLLAAVASPASLNQERANLPLEEFRSNRRRLLGSSGLHQSKE
jgi:hypothetical protein